MDFFGIGSSMKAAAHIVTQTARRSGRTTRLVESLKDGDCVVFVDQNEAARVRRLCQQKGVNVDIRVQSRIDPAALFDCGKRSQGRTIFDHDWVERYYLSAIERAESEIDRMQRDLSGWEGAKPEMPRFEFGDRSSW